MININIHNLLHIMRINGSLFDIQLEYYNINNK